jgi:hypothetical protein
MPVSRKQAMHGYNKVVRSEEYDKMMHAAHILTTSSLSIAMYKSPEEKKQIAEEADRLFQKLWECIGKEPPLVASLALLTAIDTTVELLNEQAQNHQQEMNKWR